MFKYTRGQFECDNCGRVISCDVLNANHFAPPKGWYATPYFQVQSGESYGTQSHILCDAGECAKTADVISKLVERQKIKK